MTYKKRRGKIKSIEECHRIIKHEQKIREAGEQAIKALKKTMPSEIQTKYNQRDINKRRKNYEIQNTS